MGSSRAAGERPNSHPLAISSPSSSSSSAGDHRPSVSGAGISPEEFMFDKVVTPSDVGKLNRLVIPKQHAERHFPLDTSTYQSGLQLGFVDPSGKSWRFRYSYWKSSQSYVITKGWSRFVKEKRLRAGDTVSFWRGGRGGCRHQVLFIDLTRRHPSSFPWPPLLSFPSSSTGAPDSNLSFTFQSSAAATGGGGGSGGAIERVINSFPAAKRVRLFGVNLDCSPEKAFTEMPLPPLVAPSLSEMVGLQWKNLRRSL